jgi:opacity protein-like surface antigen
MKTHLIAAALAALVTVPAFAQSAATPGIDQRQANQERRIDQGVASGELNARETARLDRGQQHVDNMENRAKSDGVVTKGERAKIHATQDRQSKRIYRQKHDRQQAR